MTDNSERSQIPPTSNQCIYCGRDDGHNEVCITVELERWKGNYQTLLDDCIQRRADIERLTRERDDIELLRREVVANEAIARQLENERDRLRAPLERLTNGYKYSTEVCQIAREALKGEPDSAPETAACLQPSCKHDWVGDDRCAYCVLEDHKAVLNECESLLHELLDEDGVDIGFDDRLTAYWEKSKAAYAWRSRDLKLVPESPSKATAHPGPSIEKAFARSPRRVETSDKSLADREVLEAWAVNCSCGCDACVTLLEYFGLVTPEPAPSEKVSRHAAAGLATGSTDQPAPGASLSREVEDLRNHIFNGVDIMEAWVRQFGSTNQLSSETRQWCAVQISRAAATPVLGSATLTCYSPCEKHQGIPFSMTIVPAAPIRTVCPICEPPPVATHHHGIYIDAPEDSTAVGYSMHVDRNVIHDGPRETCPKCSAPAKASDITGKSQ